MFHGTSKSLVPRMLKVSLMMCQGLWDDLIQCGEGVDMEPVEFLPLGSVVIVRGAVRKTVVIARGLAAQIAGQTKVFDYGGCVYPEGLLGDQIAYFNHEDIAKVVFEGFSDDDNVMMVENIMPG